MAKKTRKELLKREDAFLAAANQSAEWLQSNGRMVALAALVVVLGLLAVWGVASHGRNQDAVASALYGEAVKIRDGVVVGEGAGADPAGVPPTFATDEAKWNAAREAFTKVVEEGSGSDVAQLAKFYLADAHEQLGDLATAAAIFRTLSEELSDSSSLYFLSVERLGYVLEQQNEPDEALTAFAALSVKENGFYGDYGLYHQARVLIGKGDHGAAREKLDQLERRYPDSALKSKAGELLALVGPSNASRGNDLAKLNAEATGAEPARQAAQ